jgi:hypothetical protein
VGDYAGERFQGLKMQDTVEVSNSANQADSQQA